MEVEKVTAVIPKQFSMGASKVNITFDNSKLNAMEVLGIYSKDFNSIELASGENGRDYPLDTILDTFYHEKIHAIFKFIGREDLSNDEALVDTFGKVLRQTDETSIY